MKYQTCSTTTSSICVKDLANRDGWTEEMLIPVIRMSILWIDIILIQRRRMGRRGNVHSCEVELAQVRHLGHHLEQQLPLLLVHHCRALHPSVVLSHLQLMVRPFRTINPVCTFMEDLLGSCKIGSYSMDIGHV